MLCITGLEFDKKSGSVYRGFFLVILLFLLIDFLYLVDMQ